ncbi:MAG: hypothetical protein NTY77_04115 [Elusimicrobia bacterium]|nr:hypothetical protein [Elusimicrobiota bacterium]
MKKATILMLACALLVPALGAMAQEQGGPPKGEGQGKGLKGPKGPLAKFIIELPAEHPMTTTHFADMMAERLQLSDEQKSKVQKVMATSKPGLQEKFAEILKVRKEMQALEKDLWDKIRATLNDDQKKSFGWIDRWPGGPSGPGEPGLRQGGQQGGRGEGPGGQGRGEQPAQPPQEWPGGGK